MRKIIAIAAAVTFAGVTAAAAADSTSDKLKMNDNGGVTNQPGGKTSDRTPNTDSPDRGPGAGTSGAVGTGAAKTPEGTSTRTPDSSKQRSMD
jgi:hypothetical protein